MGNYTQVLITAGIGNGDGLTLLAETWKRTQGGTVCLMEPYAHALYLERKSLDESVLMAAMLETAWEHSEYLQVWFWREGDGQWHEKSWRSGEWESVYDDTIWALQQASRIALRLYDDLPLDEDDRAWIEALRADRARALEKKAIEAAWWREWGPVIERQAKELMKEST